MYDKLLKSNNVIIYVGLICKNHIMNHYVIF